MERVNNLRSIVIFRALQLGDLLCAVPAFRALRAGVPGARITLVGLPWAQSFVQRFSAYLDEFISFPGWPGLPEQEPAVERVPAFLQAVQSQSFDLALQMQGSGDIANPLVMLFGARQAAGYFQPGQYCPPGDLFIPYPTCEHEIRIFLSLIESLGIPTQGKHLEFPISMEERGDFNRFSAQYHLQPGEYICIHPGARYAGRRWSPEKFAAVGDALAKQGIRVILTGAESEQAITHAVAASMEQPALDLAGKTSLATLAQLVGDARLLISNDTGVSHIAAAMRAPSVILFNASDPQRWRPLDERLHRVVLNADSASAVEVLQAAEPLLNKLRDYAQ